MKCTAILPLAVSLGAALFGGCATSTVDSSDAGKLRHVVMFQFKDGTDTEQIKTIENAFRELPEKIPAITAFEWGTNMSPENLNADLTHCFLVTFDDAAGLATYLPHEAHQSFVELLQPSLEKVLVLDYIAAH